MKKLAFTLLFVLTSSLCNAQSLDWITRTGKVWNFTTNKWSNAHIEGLEFNVKNTTLSINGWMDKESKLFESDLMVTQKIPLKRLTLNVTGMRSYFKDFETDYFLLIDTRITLFKK